MSHIAEGGGGRYGVRVRPSPDQLHAFLKRYAAAGFPYSNTIVPLLDRTDAAKVDLFDGASLTALRVTYRARARLLASRRPPPTTATMAAEVLALSRALDDAREQPVRIWRIAPHAGPSFHVFELAEDRCLAGVVASTDHSGRSVIKQDVSLGVLLLPA